ncbi:MAG: sigma-70 family RNA polymerase sigma factor [Cytophagales bacterium]|nr:sigma-70 family RNA polymerase sigma factor [Cytophagales bacterium]
MYRIDETDYLLDSFVRGNPDSFEKIYKSLYPVLYNYGRQFNINEADTDDCIQEVFVDIWNSRSRIKIKSLKAYLMRCVRNKILKILSTKIKENVKAENYTREEFEISYHPLQFEIDIQNNLELEEKLKQHIARLGPRQREIIFLIYYNNLSYVEVAEILNLKIKTVYNHVHNSINYLRASLK